MVLFLCGYAFEYFKYNIRVITMEKLSKDVLNNDAFGANGSKRPNLDNTNNAALQIYILNSLLKNAFKYEFDADDMELKLAQIVYFLYCYPLSSQGELVQALGIAQPSLSDLLRKLVHADMIVKFTDDFDLRIKRFKLTDKGFEKARKTASLVKKFNTVLMSDLSESETEAFMATLSKLTKNIDRYFYD